MNFIQTVLSVNIALIGGGLFVGWSSPFIPKLQDEESSVYVTDCQASWIVALPILGNILGALISSLLLHWVGRKSILLYSAIPEIIGWLMCAFASTVQELYVARFIMGTGMGFQSSTISLYITEIAPAKHRGLFNTLSYLSMKIGILIAYSIGAIMSLKTVSLLSMTAPVLFFIWFSWCPESPHYLVLHGKYDSARESLIKLRGTLEVDEELKMIKDMVDTDRATHIRVCDWISVPANRKAFFIIFFLEMAGFCTGSETVFGYAQTIFDSANMGLHGSFLAVLLAIIQVVTFGGMMFLIDSGGRKPLLLFSLSGAAGCSFIIAVYFYLQENGRDVSVISWLATVSIFLFTISYSIGISSIPRMMMAELFAPSVKPKAAAFFVVLADVCAFIELKSFYDITMFGGLNTLFFIFTVCDVLGILHVAFFVPETKQKTLKEVLNMVANTEDKTQGS